MAEELDRLAERSPTSRGRALHIDVMARRHPTDRSPRAVLGHGRHARAHDLREPRDWPKRSSDPVPFWKRANATPQPAAARSVETVRMEVGKS